MPRERIQSNELGQYLDPPSGVLFGSNAVRLGAVQWIVAAVILTTIYMGLPRVWQWIEPLEITPDHRIPYSLSEDYWLYERYAKTVLKNRDIIPVVGDSVIWGQYVRPGETLSHALNKQTGKTEFANLGVNGSHPVALSGLITYYGAAIADRKIILQYNPLWMSSKRRDLQITKATTFNHPQLVPQFYPRIPCYDATVSDRLSIAIARDFTFLSWTAHLRRTYFDNQSLASWAIENPYANPLGALTLRLPQPEDSAPSDPIPWAEKDARSQSFDWVAPENSLQWAFFKRSLSTLQSRGNRVFVILGPFNEHMLTDESRAIFADIHADMDAWLVQSHVDHLAPAVLPSGLYADASHPIAEGYVALATFLLESDSFRTFLDR
ncbi:MAG: hypothetical protein SGI88_13675 [Candidatus Hydrogenedentes bacterium]|nr:hypothetical protein [Candidatus Hydrogenedentota bacterium]